MGIDYDNALTSIDNCIRELVELRKELVREQFNEVNALASINKQNIPIKKKQPSTTIKTRKK